jgi:3-dehydroquinate synthase
MKTLHVHLGERSYPIHIGEGIVGRLGEWFAERNLSRRSPLMIISDQAVADLHLPRVRDVLEEAGYRVATAVVPSGETSKSLAMLEKLAGEALKAGLDRRSAIVALGGGVVGDLAGFVAASYMRGIRYVQMPTTILAHDSSVGGKVAVNHPLAKNIIGAFHQPEMVVFELSFLRTLPEREIRNGYAEVIKHGLIADAAFFRWIDEQADRLLALEPAAVEHALLTGCRIKADIVSADEREEGLRAILNVGHTIGHALEAVAGYGELLHGEAIAIGMAGETLLAVHYGCPESVHRETVRVLRKFGLPVSLPAGIDPDRVLEAMGHDKKFREGKAVFALPTELGAAAVREGVPAGLVRDILQQLKREA